MLEPNVDLELAPEKAGSWTIVRVKGELDSATESALSRFVEELADAGAAFVALDLAKLRFMDSTGLGALLQSEVALRRSGGRMALVCPSRIARKVLDITGMSHYFRIHDSVAALARLEPEPATIKVRPAPEIWVG